MMQLRVIKGPSDVGHNFALNANRSMTIGREADCDIQLSAKGVSKKHCRLSLLPGSRVEVEDLRSSNGTFVNGVMVKKHVMVPGDVLNVHEFTLRLGVKAPDIAVFASAPQPDPVQFTPAPAEVVAAPQGLGEKMGDWMGRTIYPLADSLSAQFDIRVLVTVFFLIWSAIIITLTASPFSQKANERVRNEAIQVAALYARQLVRVNQQAIIDQHYKDLVNELDARSGANARLVSSILLDSTKAQIIAPAELFGQSLPNAWAGKAIAKDEEFAQVDSEGIAYVSAPIKIGTPGGNKTVATAFVTIDTINNQFSFSAIVDQIVNSLLIALLISILFLIFIYRWVEGSISTFTANVDEALKNAQPSISTPVKWPALRLLGEQVSFAIGRSQGAAPAPGLGGGDPTASQWARATANSSGAPSAAFDTALTVTAWNSEIERVIGIRANIAIGADIAAASRDVSFESNVRNLAAETASNPWTPATRTVEVSGDRYSLTMIYGSDAYLITLAKNGDE